MGGAEPGFMAYLANLATVLTGAAALLALLFAVHQTRANHATQLEALARDHFQHFLELCILYPDFANPSAVRLDVDGGTFDGDPDKFAQYEWFFTACENALEAIFDTVGEQKAWREEIRAVLGEHALYLSSTRYHEVFRNTVDRRFQRFIDSWITRRGVAGPLQR